MHLGFFPALLDKPARVRFVHQEPDEYIELLLRRHWVTNVRWVLASALALFAPFLLPVIDRVFNVGFSVMVPLEVETGVIVLWYMFVFASIIENILFWYFNTYIVTNKRLIDVDFRSLLYRDIKEAQLSDIEGISEQMSGILGSLFNLGDVIVETAAKSQRIEFLSVPNPDEVADRIQDLEGRYKEDVI